MPGVSVGARVFASISQIHLPRHNTYIITPLIRVKNKCAFLKGECKHYYWRYLDTAWCIGHYAANLQPPLRVPKDFDKLESKYEDLVENI